MKIVLPPIHEKLSHLSPEQIEELIKEFYTSHKSTHLIENYQIDLFFGISRYFIASIRGGWGIKNVKPNDMISSVISDYFYNDVIRIGRDAYLISPGKSNMLSEN